MKPGRRRGNEKEKEQDRRKFAKWEEEASQLTENENPCFALLYLLMSMWSMERRTATIIRELEKKVKRKELNCQVELCRKEKVKEEIW